MAFRKVLIIGLFFWLINGITLILKIKKKKKIIMLEFSILHNSKLIFNVHSIFFRKFLEIFIVD